MPGGTERRASDARAGSEHSRDDDRFFGRYAALCACATLLLFLGGLVAAPADERTGVVLISGFAGAVVALAAWFVWRGLSRGLFLVTGIVLMALGVVVGAALPDGLDGAAVLPLAGALLVLPVLRGRPLFVMFATAFGASLVGETAAYVVGGMTHLTRLVSAPLSLAQSGVMLAFTYGLVWWVSNQWRLASERSEEALAIQRQILASQRQVLALNERLLATLDPQQVLNLIADSLKAVVPYDNLTIYRVDHDAGVFRPVLARDRFASLILENTFPLEHGITGWVLTHGVAQCVNDAQLDPRMALIPGTPSEDESLIIVPLLIDGDVGGTLNVGRMGGAASHFDSSEFEIAQLLASQASIALQNAEAHHAVSTRAATDALTGLRNRGAFEEDIAALLADRNAQPLTLLMLDLDGFKAFNDQLGHPAGDRLLGTVARAMSAAVRADDRVYRYGGDEFAVLLPGTTRGVGEQVAQRICSAIAAIDAGAGARITASVGAASHPADAATRDDLVAAADTALYRAKAPCDHRAVVDVAGAYTLAGAADRGSR
ncbi:MAG: diguanylate cyclase domain-containing protein [Candidatus Limnocylindrales bacterium]